MIEIIRSGTEIDFAGKRKLWLSISVVAVIATFVLFFTKGLNYGIDFTGGAEVQVKVPQGVDIGTLREKLSGSGFGEVKVVQLGLPEDRQFLLKAQGDEGTLQKVASNVASALGKEYEVLRVDVVGPAAGSSLRLSGYLSMLYALICILIYVTIRFDARYSPGAVLALVHDTVITLGIFVLTAKQFDLQILAALLALIGYSNNDTIIVYDRVRETLQNHPKLNIREAVNRAINETLGRTLLTSIATFLTVFSLWLLGGKVIQDFAFTMMIGIVVGTYSSIVVASSIVIYITEWQQRREKRLRSMGKPRYT